MKIFVTGAAGYIGSVLCPHLLSLGFKVVAIDSLLYHNVKALLPCFGHANFQFFHENVRGNGQLVKEFQSSEVVIPLAALVGAPLCDKYPELAEQTNHQSICKLVDELYVGQRIIFPNTNSGYGERPSGEECEEDDELTPVSIYGKTKCAAEAKVLTHKNSVVLRLATVFGPSPRMRFDLMVNDFTNKLTRIKHGCKEPFLLYEPHFKRNFVHVRDVARVFTWFVVNDHCGVYNVGLPDANLTKLQLAHAICDVVGVSREVVQVGDGEDQDKRNYVVSNCKLLGAGFRFQHGLEKGIREVQTLCELLPSAEVVDMRNF